MKLQNKIGMLSVTITVVLMYVALIWLLPLVRGYPALKFLGTVILSVALYRLIASGSYFVLGKSLWLRKKALGEEFIEGTWVGKIRREPIEYTIEEYRYRNGVIEIEGRSFLEDKTPTSHWNSTAVGLDIGNRKLFYAYECRTESKERPPEGVALFRLQWENKELLSCDRLEGFAADLSDGKKDSNTEHKASDEWLGFEKGLEKAIEIFGRS